MLRLLNMVQLLHESHWNQKESDATSWFEKIPYGHNSAVLKM